MKAGLQRLPPLFAGLRARSQIAAWRVMKPRFKVLQLQPDYNVKTHDFADLGEQIVKALPAERFEVTSGFLSGEKDSGCKTHGQLHLA